MHGGKRPSSGRKRKSRRIIDVGPRPKDVLEVAGEYVPKIAHEMLYQLLHDTDLSDRERRQEARQLMKLIVSTVPFSRILKAERHVTEAASAMERTNRNPQV